jgi:hypothetical protein
MEYTEAEYNEISGLTLSDIMDLRAKLKKDKYKNPDLKKWLGFCIYSNMERQGKRAPEYAIFRDLMAMIPDTIEFKPPGLFRRILDGIKSYFKFLSIAFKEAKI